MFDCVDWEDVKWRATCYAMYSLPFWPGLALGAAVTWWVTR